MNFGMDSDLILVKSRRLTIVVWFSVIVVPVPEHDNIQGDPDSKQDCLQDGETTHHCHPKLPWVHLIASS